MLVISDTSPITNLLQIEQLDLLHSLYQTIIIPESVFEELTVISSQAKRLQATEWIKIHPINDTQLYENLLKEVDRGEAEAMVLALELQADLLIIDEQTGRSVAENLGINITGVLGILVKAKQEGLIQAVRIHMERLRDEAAFRIHPKLFNAILRMVDEL